MIVAVVHRLLIDLPCAPPYGDRRRPVLDPAADPSLIPPSGLPVCYLEWTGNAGNACSLGSATP